MKKVYLIFSSVLLLGFIIFSCKKEYSPNDAVNDQIKLNDQATKDSLLRDSLRRTSGVIHYSINIVDGSDATFSKILYKTSQKQAAIQNVKVIAVQYGKTFTVTDTSGLGIVTIKDLRVGTVSVRIQAENFTECSFVAQLAPMSGADTLLYRTTHSDIWNLERYVATLIPVFPTTGAKMATISGVVTYESDLTNVDPEKAANVDVFGVIDADDEYFMAKYVASFETLGDWSKTNCSQYGQIVKIAYNSAVFKGTTDANGVYSVKVPATADGLPIRMEISDVAVDQKLLLNTLRGTNVFGDNHTVRTLFSSSYTPSSIPTVASAYCVFDAPKGNGTSSDPTTAAAATAVISESGIISITMSDPGYGYTQDPKITITGAGSVIKPATTTLTRTGDKITDIAVNDGGVGYTSATVSITGSEIVTATATPVLTYSVNKINVSYGGTGYASTPPAVTVYSSSGSGATATATMKGYLSAINLSSGGSGYVNPPTVVISGGNGSGASATATLTAGSVSGITITSTGTGYTSAPSISFVAADGVGSGAAASTDIRYAVDYISVTNAGSGYSLGDATVIIAAPPVPGIQATASATFGSGVISKIDIGNSGLGYTAAPNVVISGGGATVDATATATVAGGLVTNIAVNTGGVGYTSAPTVTIKTFLRSATATALCNSMAGKIIAVNLTNNGEGYASTPVVDFYYPNTGTLVNGNGSAAKATATVSNGRVTDVTITDGGTGYYTAPSVRFRMANVNQIAKASLTIVDGYITGISIADGGNGYDTIPNITINPSVTNMGTGAKAVVTQVANSRVVTAKIINRGSGYVGRNYPTSAKSFSIITAGSSGTNIESINALTGKSYVRDIYLGTGKRTIED